MGLLTPTVRGVQQERAPKPAEKRAAEALLDRPDAVACGGREAPGGDADRRRRAPPARGSACAVSTSSRCRWPRWPRPGGCSPRSGCRSGRCPAAASARPPQGRIDRRATLRAALRRGDLHELKPRSPPYPLAEPRGALRHLRLDVAYRRALLHFLHAVANREGRGWAEVHGFTFGTRLTNITRHLRTRDVDAALAARRGRGAGLGGRHPDRRRAARLQPRLVAPGAGAGGGRAPGHRRAGPGRADRLAFEARRLHLSRTPGDLAEPAPALRRLRAEGRGHPRAAAPCRQPARRAFHRRARRAGGDCCRGPTIRASSRASCKRSLDVERRRGGGVRAGFSAPEQAFPALPKMRCKETAGYRITPAGGGNKGQGPGLDRAQPSNQWEASMPRSMTTFRTATALVASMSLLTPGLTGAAFAQQSDEQIRTSCTEEAGGDAAALEECIAQRTPAAEQLRHGRAPGDGTRCRGTNGANARRGRPRRGGSRPRGRAG